jgi:hypothetical protein
MPLKIYKNLYKKRGIFRCVHDVHQHFKAEMSPFHILSNKDCFPHGCVYFKWTCRYLARHKTCFRGFTHVGKECFNCQYFGEEKVHQYPEPLLEEKEHAQFIEDFGEFEEWVEDLENNRCKCEGKVYRVQPDFRIYRDRNGMRLALRGFLVVFTDGFIANKLFEDRFYLAISSQTQNKLQIRAGDDIEYEANLEISRGRFRFYRPGKFEFFARGSEKAPRKADIEMARLKYQIHLEQNNKCLACAHGILADMETDLPGPRRALVCLQGVKNTGDCTLFEEEMRESENDTCANRGKNSVSCKHAL